MAKRKHVAGQQIGFLLGQASQPPMQSGPMMSNPTPFSSPGGTGQFLGGNSPFQGGGTPFQGVRPPFQGGGLFQGGPGAAVPPMPPTGGSGGIGGLLQGLFGGNGGINLPSILSNAQKMIGAVNQAGEVFRNVGPMLQLLKGFDISELLQSDDDAEVLTEVDNSKKKKKKTKKRKYHSRKKRKSAKSSKSREKKRQ